MSEILISPGRVTGETRVQGAKNSVLPIMAATLLVRGEVILRGCPDLADVDSAIHILLHLGCTVRREDDAVIIDASDITDFAIPDDLMRRMRSSVIFLGAILSRTGQARMTYPGGCELGPRPIDMHLDALRRLGAHIDEEGGRIVGRADVLHGADITLRFPSVGTTENALITACAACGTTTIRNAAREPEIADLVRFLRAVGCRVRGENTSVLTVEGGMPTHGAEYRVIADRIAAGTYLCAAAATGGTVLLRDTEPAHLSTLCNALAEAGCEIDAEERWISLRAPEKLRAPRMIVTRPYPGFPTDLQAPLMAALLRIDGSAVFDETIFKDRYRHAAELAKMGADIVCEGSRAIVCGVPQLHGAKVIATDLRGGAAMIIAALSAKGDSTILEAEHIDRGYENVTGVFAELGVKLQRI
ncbi:MAG: UDP-N-acetylglucosamine 1-carboxyvinyltransferase [Clostridiaceae bacterium]|nr:UDP-N-acetylglucosamine 1-carboxyvinyltransferase [Clostridiaceae bacterium]